MPTNYLKCGTALSSGAAFCANCGWQVTDPGMATVAVASNASGLAEATLTLGGSAGSNSATAMGTSASLGTGTFTANGT
ncbi:MAG: hypothetical protein Q8Q85_04480 [Gemmatimonadales bacterium]|nr:hypothetical protein [Gemmatimonadales bacterium]